MMSFSLAVTIVCVWILTGHWLLMDGNCRPVTVSSYEMATAPSSQLLMPSNYLSKQLWAWACAWRSLLSSVCPV